MSSISSDPVESGYADWTQDGLVGLGMKTAVDHPELVNCISTAMLWAIGDVLAQLFERSKQRAQTHLPLSQSPSHASTYDRPEWRFNYARTLRLASFAGLLFAPVTKMWFEFLEATFPGEGLAVAVQRMLLDQAIYSTCVIVSLFVWVGMLESGGSVQHTLAKVQTNYC